MASTSNPPNDPNDWRNFNEESLANMYSSEELRQSAAQAANFDLLGPHVMELERRMGLPGALDSTLDFIDTLKKELLPEHYEAFLDEFSTAVIAPFRGVAYRYTSTPIDEYVRFVRRAFSMVNGSSSVPEIAKRFAGRPIVATEFVEELRRRTR